MNRGGVWPFVVIAFVVLPLAVWLVGLEAHELALFGVALLVALVAAGSVWWRRRRSEGAPD